MAESYNSFSYWFQERIVDNNGVSVSDINAGMKKLLPGIMEKTNDLNNPYFNFVLPENEKGKPDAASYLCYGNDNLWWYICLSNLIDNPFEEISNKFKYFAFEPSYVTEQGATTEQILKEKESKIGKVIALN